MPASVMTISREGQSLFEALDADRDRRLGTRELLAAPERIAALDLDKNGVVVETELVGSYRLTFEISRGGQQVPPPLLALFTLPQGRARILPAPNGQGWFIVHHAQRTPGDASTQPALIATTRTEFTQSASEELAQQFARSIERQVGVERDEAAIQRSRARLIGDYGGGAE